MFLTLLGVTFFISLLVSAIVVWLFTKPVETILRRIISDTISSAWVTYIKFGLFVTGISSGVRVWELERYISPPQHGEAVVLQLNRDRWILEVYRTIIGALGGLAGVLLIFFIFALIAFVIVRVFELKREKVEAK